MKRGLRNTLIILGILVFLGLTFFLIDYARARKQEKTIEEHQEELGKQSEEKITIGVAYSIDMQEKKSTTLNQEETKRVIEILNKLSFKKETCDGIAKYYINYNNEDTDISYGLETYDSIYHITLGGKGEAILSEDEKNYVEQILKKYFN